MKKFDVTALGELLVDFTENGMSAQGNPLLEAKSGRVLRAMYFPCCRILEKRLHLLGSRSRHVWYNVDAGGERPGNQYR